MNRTDAPGNVSGKFVEPDPGTDTDGTEVSAKFLTNVSESIVRAIEAAGLTPTDGTDGDESGYDQLKLAIAGAAGLVGAQDFVNLFINGSFALWQRATSSPPVFTLAAGAQCTADRFMCDPGGGTAVVSKQDLGAGLGSEKRATSDLLQWQQTVAGAPRIEQRLELLERLDGQKITLSIDLRTPSGSLTIVPYVRQNFGVGGSGDVQVTAAPINVGTVRTRFKITFDVPSIAGKTRGAGYYTAVGLSLPNGSTFTLEASAAQCQFGPIATEFACPDSSVELLRAQRYFFTTYEPGTALLTPTHTGAFAADDAGISIEGLNRLFPVPMRTVPLLTYISPGTGVFGKVERPPGSDATVSAINGTSSKSTGTPVTGAVSAGVAAAHFAADAEL